MTANHIVRVRVDEDLKNQATAILATMGLTVSDFVRISLAKVVNEGRLPFDIHTPNQLTIETLEKSDQGKDLHRAKNAASLFGKLDI